MLQNKVKDTELRKLVSKRVADYLSSHSYQVETDVKITGQSGVEHVFDIVARRNDGFTTRTMAVCITLGSNQEEESSAIFNFANKAFDTGINERILIAIPKLTPETRNLAEKQRIKVFDEDRLEDLLVSNTKHPSRLESIGNISTREDLINALTGLGYTIRENARIKGRSGISHVFDIVANDINTDNYTLGIDIIKKQPSLELQDVALFDAKAFDCGIVDKLIATASQITSDAQQFADAQKVKLIKFKPVTIATEEGAAVNTAEEVIKTSAKTDTKNGKTAITDLRQSPRPEALKLIPEVLARRYTAIPLNVVGNTLEMAMADPSDILALEAFSAHSKRRIKPIPADAREIREAIDFNYKGYGDIEKYLSRMSIPSEVTDDRLAIDAAIDAPLAQALNLIIEEAVKARSSDVHIEPNEDRLRVRFRIDGTLQDMMSLPITAHRAIISRIKILGDMNIADHFHALDGQFTVNAGGREIDIRAATAPTVNGEMAVLRLLDKSRATIELSQLGFLPDSLEKYNKMLKVPYGMILISGPTGAGKTTTLYASINSLDIMRQNIITIEDPAEYRFKDINQIQVNTQAGITFASGLRSILRLDPDVILVGEIRDAETANIAVQAALTGHLMLSSIHANDTTGVLYRLIDLGVEPFLIASAVVGVVAQRMVRRICPYCQHTIEVPVIEQVAYEREIGEKRTKFVYGSGCKSCAFTGYLGRVGLFEIMTISDEIRRLMLSGASPSEIHAQSIKDGMITMMKDGMLKVKDNITTPSEVLRSAYSPEEQY
ncbi:secretion system protein E [Dehalococcoides mccartyi]|uniref:Secretion system protein E n=1 Tax=Dehalococcoides mccartyi TaxID=61435 RepID=A0A0V8M395_9CHLR|nr:GspE/PulE family protein [Dehalococcoides mccartyi]AII59896.1 secretion system protein E [Dehalococcoides mccartyi CG4]KSV18001.1 secretion system protein E [Dehalococcoides mccartyi]